MGGSERSGEGSGDDPPQHENSEQAAKGHAVSIGEEEQNAAEQEEEFGDPEDPQRDQDPERISEACFRMAPASGPMFLPTRWGSRAGLGCRVGGDARSFPLPPIGDQKVVISAHRSIIAIGHRFEGPKRPLIKQVPTHSHIRGAHLREARVAQGGPGRIISDHSTQKAFAPLQRRGPENDGGVPAEGSSHPIDPFR